MKSLFILSFLLINLIGFCQDSLIVNQYNSNGDKIGLWEQRLDERLCPTESDDFSYIVYNRYDVDGRKIYKHTCHNWSKKDYILKITDSSYTSTKRYISGVFFQIDYSGDTILLEKYVNGLPLYFRVDYSISDVAFPYIENYYFDSLYNNISGSYLYQDIDEKGTLIRYYHDGYLGWNQYSIEDTINNLKYPYFKETPPLVAIVIGYNFFQNNQLEIGLLLNRVH